MASVDFRTRPDSDTTALDATDFLERVSALLELRGQEAGTTARRLGLAPLTFDVEGEMFTLFPHDHALELRRDGPEELVVVTDQRGLSDLVEDAASTFGLEMTGRADVRRGTVDAFVEWEPVLRFLLDGRPVYESGTVDLRDRRGDPLDLHRSFSLDDDPLETGHFLIEAGYLHLEGVFSEAEMSAVSAELDSAIASARKDDGASWWAQTAEGEWYPSRILGFNQKSQALRSLLSSERIAAIGTFTDDEFVQRDPNAGDSAEGLLKKVGVVEGISDVSWHKDCAMGGHSRRCCGLTVGISVTGAGRENGELGVVAGSHRANVMPLGITNIDLPRVPLPTRTGDVTVHCSCTLHMSRPPVSAERRVVYTGFTLAPQKGDERSTGSESNARRERAALGDQARRHQHDRSLGAHTASFDL
jgi:hypothetical protein